MWNPLWGQKWSALLLCCSLSLTSQPQIEGYFTLIHTQSQGRAVIASVKLDWIKWTLHPKHVTSGVHCEALNKGKRKTSSRGEEISGREESLKLSLWECYHLNFKYFCIKWIIINYNKYYNKSSGHLQTIFFRSEAVLGEAVLKLNIFAGTYSMAL